MIYRQPIEVLTAGQWARADEWQISQAQAPARRGAAIIDAAAQVFADRGFYGASTRDVADVLGIRPASYRAATAGPMSAHSQRTSVSADREPSPHRPVLPRRRAPRRSKSALRRANFGATLIVAWLAIALLGMLNAVAAWYGKEPKTTMDKIASQFARLFLNGIDIPRKRVRSRRPRPWAKPGAKDPASDRQRGRCHV